MDNATGKQATETDRSELSPLRTLGFNDVDGLCGRAHTFRGIWPGRPDLLHLPGLGNNPFVRASIVPFVGNTPMNHSAAKGDAPGAPRSAKRRAEKRHAAQSALGMFGGVYVHCHGCEQAGGVTLYERLVQGMRAIVAVCRCGNRATYTKQGQLA